jgi:hypothetical protein
MELREHRLEAWGCFVASNYNCMHVLLLNVGILFRARLFRQAVQQSIIC